MSRLVEVSVDFMFELGLGDSLCGVTFECDHPAAATALPQVSGTSLPVDGDLTPAQIEAATEYAKVYPKPGRPLPRRSFKKMLADMA